jgi:nitronate monooxygenase
MRRDNPSKNVNGLLVASNFVEVYLAKEGHNGLVGINYLEKLQAPTLPSLYGAMLADVDYVLMGAGIPRTIPAVLDDLSKGLPVELRLDLNDATAENGYHTHFDPATVMNGVDRTVKRPDFLAIVSSHVLATMLVQRIDTPVDGFVVEAPIAGGHNAPPRGKLRLDKNGEPIYGDRDVPDFSAIRKLNLPFWLAGGYAYPDRIREALELGAAGVQVGTAFAFCEESGLEADAKRQVLDLSRQAQARIFTDPQGSPTGYPFKVVQLEGTLSESDVYEQRKRVCELGYLRSAYRKDNGKIGWRCPAEPVDEYVAKGGKAEDATGKKCLCSALMANVGLGQIQREGARELTLITSGNDVEDVARFLPQNADSYSANDVIRHLLPDG